MYEWSSAAEASRCLQAKINLRIATGFLILKSIKNGFASFLSFSQRSLRLGGKLFLDPMSGRAELSCLLPFYTVEKEVVTTSYLSLFSLRASSEGIRQVPQSQHTIPSINFFHTLRTLYCFRDLTQFFVISLSVNHLF